MVREEKVWLLELRRSFLLAPQSGGRDECWCSSHCLIFSHSGTPAFCCSSPGSPNCTLTPPAPCSLSCRLSTGSAMDLTRNVPLQRPGSPRRTLSRWAWPRARTEGITTPPISSFPCALLAVGGAGHALHDPCLLCSQAQKENYRQEKKRATKQLFSALTDPSVVIMADSLKVGRCHSQRLLATGTFMALGKQV